MILLFLLIQCIRNSTALTIVSFLTDFVQVFLYYFVTLFRLWPLKGFSCERFCWCRFSGFGDICLEKIQKPSWAGKDILAIIKAAKTKLLLLLPTGAIGDDLAFVRPVQGFVKIISQPGLV